MDNKDTGNNINLVYESFLETFELEVSVPSYKCLKIPLVHHAGQGIF